MEGRADQGCLVQPLNFLLQWAWRFRCSGFGPTCLLYLFVFSLSSSSFPPNASSQLQMGCLPLPTARPQDLAALGLVWREHMHLPPGLCCCCSSLCQVAEGAVQHPSSSGNWKDPGGSEEGQWSAQVPPAWSKGYLYEEPSGRALGSNCSRKVCLVHVGTEPKHAVSRKCLIRTQESQTVYLSLRKGGDTMSLETASEVDCKVVRPEGKTTGAFKGNGLAWAKGWKADSQGPFSPTSHPRL